MADPYTLPVLYDLEYQHQSDDVAFYVGVAAANGGPVFELGCGNGRLMLPIARSGVDISGIDASAPMLADLDHKLALEPEHIRGRVHPRLADFRTAEVEPVYKLVIWPFNALHHCPTGADVVRALNTARRALAPGAALYVDCYLPDRRLYARTPHGRYEERTFTDPRDGGTLMSWETGRWDEQTRIHHVTYVYQRADGTEDHLDLKLHMYEKEELLRFIHEAGLRILWQSSDFFGAPMAPTSLKWVMQLIPR